MNTEILTGLLLALVQILILTVIFYWVLRLLKGTSVLWLIVTPFVLGWLYRLTEFLHMKVLSILMKQTVLFLPFIILVLLKDEIRHMLGKVGKLFQFTGSKRHLQRKFGEPVLQALVEAIGRMSATMTGALIAIEQRRLLEREAATGKHVDAALEPGNKVLETIFYKGSPLHDGGAIVREGRLLAAGCVYPLSNNVQVQDEFGMRHQACLGLSENTDAIVLVVSEETGHIHIAWEGQMQQVSGTEELYRILKLRLGMESPEERPRVNFWDALRARVRFFRRARKRENSKG